MKYSFVIPVFNANIFLSNCIESIISLHSSGNIDIELILIDDGSIDDSGQICDEFSHLSDYYNIIVIKTKNNGVSAARNIGIEFASGTYVNFIDSDDSIDTLKLVKCFDVLLNNPDIDMLIYGMSFDYYDGDRCYRRDELVPLLEGKMAYDTVYNNLLSLYYTNSLSSLCNKIVKREVFINSSVRLNEKLFLYEDLEFVIRILPYCCNFYLCRDPIYHYRQVGDHFPNRLRKILHLNESVQAISEALIFIGGNTEIELSIYQILINEKASCSTFQEMKTICSDFRLWIDSKELSGRIANNGFLMKVYSMKIKQILLLKAYTRIRHTIANYIKIHFGDFRKLFKR